MKKKHAGIPVWLFPLTFYPNKHTGVQLFLSSIYSDPPPFHFRSTVCCETLGRVMYTQSF